MFYIIFLILIAFAYIFLMPKDIRRSVDIFFFAAVAVLIVAFAIAQAVSHQTILFEGLMVVAALVLTVRAWKEVGRLGPKRKHRKR